MDNKTILIIDDDVDLLKSLQIILEDKGFNVITASSTKRGMEVLETQNPDLLIQDLMMDSPLEGFSIINRIKGHPVYKNFPIIMLTGMSDAMGVNYRSAVEDPDIYPRVVFIDKPVEPEVLVAEINALLQ